MRREYERRQLQMNKLSLNLEEQLKRELNVFLTVHHVLTIH